MRKMNLLEVELMKSMLDMNIMVTKEDGSKFEYEEFYKVLSEAGFTWEGHFDLYHEEELEKAVEKIIGSVDDATFIKMKKDLMEKYDFKSEKELKERLFFSGVNPFCPILENYLDEENAEILRKYSDTYWVISDIFTGGVENKFVDKFYGGEWL